MVGFEKKVKKYRFSEGLQKWKARKEVCFFAAVQKEIIEKSIGISYNRETMSLHNSALSPAKN